MKILLLPPRRRTQIFCVGRDRETPNCERMIRANCRSLNMHRSPFAKPHELKHKSKSRNENTAAFDSCFDGC